MPKGSNQTRSDIILELKENRESTKRTDLITQEELELAMSKHGVNAPGPVRGYTKSFLAGDYLTRTNGGYNLTKASKKTATLKVRIAPTQNLAEISKAITAATQRFGATVTIEVKA